MAVDEPRTTRSAAPFGSPAAPDAGSPAPSSADASRTRAPSPTQQILLQSIQDLLDVTAGLEYELRLDPVIPGIERPFAHMFIYTNPAYDLTVTIELFSHTVCYRINGIRYASIRNDEQDISTRIEQQCCDLELLLKSPLRTVHGSFIWLNMYSELQCVDDTIPPAAPSPWKVIATFQKHAVSVLPFFLPFYPLLLSERSRVYNAWYDQAT